MSTNVMDLALTGHSRTWRLMDPCSQDGDLISYSTSPYFAKTFVNSYLKEVK